MKKIICRAALMLALCLPVCALAATEPNAKTIEDTTTYEGDTIKITIDQWCYAFNRTNLRFFVANVYVSDPAQMQTAFAGEQYSKNNAEATSAIAERHDAILAINGDYYNYKDKNGLVIRNGVLYRDAASSRDQLLVMRDGTFIALPRGTYAAGEGQKYIDEGVVQSFTFGPLLVNDGEMDRIGQRRNLCHPGAKFSQTGFRFAQQPRPAAGVGRQLVGSKQIAGVGEGEWFEPTAAALKYLPGRPGAGLPVGQRGAERLSKLIVFTHCGFLIGDVQAAYALAGSIKSATGVCFYRATRR